MRRRSLTMGEMSEFMAQEYGTANFARKARRTRGKRGKRSSLTSNAVVGRSLTGRLARGAAVAGAIGLGGTKRGRGLVRSGYGAASGAVRSGYGAASGAVKGGYGRATRAVGAARKELGRADRTGIGARLLGR
jgi:hypothetical protein